MISMQVRQSGGSGFKSRSGQIAYFHGVKTRGRFHEALTPY